QIGAIYGCGFRCAQWMALTHFAITPTSVRRFLLRPSGVALSATALSGPFPRVMNCSWGRLYFVTRYSTTDCARRLLSALFESALPTLSVFPSTRIYAPENVFGNRATWSSMVCLAPALRSALPVE